jgi:hypothetical protein
MPFLSKETQNLKVHKHDIVRELRLVVETVDLATILRNGSERDNIVLTHSSMLLQ